MGFAQMLRAIEELYTERSEAYEMNPCKVCNKTDGEKPMCFRGEEWCCEAHRKVILGDVKLKSY